MAWNATVRIVRRTPAPRGRRRCVSGSISSPANVGIGDERRPACASRCRRDRPGAVEQRRAEAEGDGERRRPEAVGLAGVVGRRVLVVVVGHRPAARRSCVAPRRSTPAAASYEIVAVVGDARRTTRTGAGPARGVTIPAWWAPWNGTTLPSTCAAAERVAAAEVPVRRDERRSGARRPPRRGTAADSPARGAHEPTTCFDTFESGSASASITCDSALVSALVRSVYGT